jgi:hypothetical protein
MVNSSGRERQVPVQIDGPTPFSFALRAGWLAALMAAGCTGNHEPLDGGSPGEEDAAIGIIRLPDRPVVVLPDAAADAALDAAVDAAADAATDAGVEAGLDAAPFDAGEVAISGDVLTNRPGLGFISTGTNDLFVVSAHFRIQETSVLDTVFVHGEYENRGSVTRCIPLMNMTIGAQIITALADGPAFDSPVSTLSQACVKPGERGAYRGIQNEIARDLLDTAGAVTYAISGLQATQQVPSPFAPTLLSADRVAEGQLFGVGGQIRTAAEPIYNVEIVFYARDAFGLIIDDTSAFPFDLATLPANETLDYRSYAFGQLRAEPDGLVHFFEYIEGVSTSSLTLSASYDAADPSEAVQRGLQRRPALADYRAQRSAAFGGTAPALRGGASSGR